MVCGRQIPGGRWRTWRLKVKYINDINGFYCENTAINNVSGDSKGRGGEVETMSSFAATEMLLHIKRFNICQHFGPVD